MVEPQQFRCNKGDGNAIQCGVVGGGNGRVVSIAHALAVNLHVRVRKVFIFYLIISKYEIVETLSNYCVSY